MQEHWYERSKGLLIDFASGKLNQVHCGQTISSNCRRHSHTDLLHHNDEEDYQYIRGCLSTSLLFLPPILTPWLLPLSSLLFYSLFFLPSFLQSSLLPLFFIFLREMSSAATTFPRAGYLGLSWDVPNPRISLSLALVLNLTLALALEWP